VNWTTAFPTPDVVREEWGGPFVGDDFARSLAAVAERSGVNTDHNTPSSRDALMKRGLDALGWHRDAMPRNVLGCDQDGPECGWCGYGCRRGAKQSTLKTWLVDAHAAGARVLVRDRGPGIAPEQQEAIFRPFQRAVSYRNVAGFGLGLHVVRRIAEAHGGAARVESAPGRGSTFFLELPL
jgi:hypothetical protein